jgi:hypothetical protein
VSVSGERHGGTFSFVGTTAVGAVASGLSVIVATVIAVDLLRSARDADLNPALYLLFGGTVAGVLVAAAVAWWLLQPIQSTYRRGGLSMVAGFATAVAMLICIPIHQVLGRAGLGGLLILCAGTSLLAGRRSRHLLPRT